MKKPILLLHVGTHKTGTTAIQAALAANRSALFDQGINYPSLKPEFKREADGHHKIAHAIARSTSADKNALTKFEERIFGESRGVDLTVISAEPFYRHKIGKVKSRYEDAWFAAHNEYLHRVAQIFQRFDIVPLCYFRKPDEMAISLYKENIVKRNFRGELEELILARNHTFEYARHIRALESNFGPVDVRIFELEREKGLIRSFLPDIELLAEVQINQEQVRTSPSNKAAIWLKELSPDLSEKQFFRRALFAVRHSGLDVFADSIRTTLWSSNSQQSHFFEKYQSSYEAPFPWRSSLLNLRQTEWTQTMRISAEGAFKDWESKNLATLRLREALKLPLFAPDPEVQNTAPLFEAIRARYRAALSLDNQRNTK